MGAAASSTYPGSRSSNSNNHDSSMATVVSSHPRPSNRPHPAPGRAWNHSRYQMPGLPPQHGRLNNNSNSNTIYRASHSNRLRPNQQQSNQQQIQISRPISNKTPGAFTVSPTPSGTRGTMYRVNVPEGVGPGDEFHVRTNTTSAAAQSSGRMVRVRCPPNGFVGQVLDITVPPEPIVRQIQAIARLTPLSSDDEHLEDAKEDEKSDTSNKSDEKYAVGQNSKRNEKENKYNSPGVTFMPNPSGTAPAYQVLIPLNIKPGQKFVVTIQGQKLAVTCPRNSKGGSYVKVVPPLSTNTQSTNQSNNDSTALSNSSSLAPAQIPPSLSSPNETEEEPSQNTLHREPSRPQVTMRTFEVAVPAGVRPGQPFTLTTDGQRVLVTCPPNVLPGQRIRFQLPHVENPDEHNTQTSNSVNNGIENKNYNAKSKNSKSYDKKAASVKLNYDTKDGWTRTIRLTDYKFQWIRTDILGQVTLHHERFRIDTSAYVRKLELKPGNDPRMRTGKLSLVPACDAAVASSVRRDDEDDTSVKKSSEELVTYADIASAQTKEFKAKVLWFQEMCKLLKMKWDLGHIRIQVRRDYLLIDSIKAVMSLGRKDLRKIWRFEFLGEEGVDAGGLAREWYQIVSQELFNADRGLWLSNVGNQMNMQINPASELSCGEDHLFQFRFLGRVMGKALFDQFLISGHMVRHLYKHILGWPVTFQDLENIDEQYYLNMKKLTTYSKEELEMLCLDFTYTEQSLGVAKEIQLKKGGKDLDVNQKNLPEYLEACTKYRLMGEVKPQLTELLLGFFDIIPEPLLTVFDYNELELLMCGLPEVDMNDWKANTEYLGTVAAKGKNHHVVKWFWEVVEEDFDQAMKAKLLQFVTGTSGVPSRGFSVLQGNDGDIRKFSIQGISLETSLFPRAHTCFNRIDLPMYKKKGDLRDKLKLAIQIEATGFSIE